MVPVSKMGMRSRERCWAYSGIESQIDIHP